MPTNETKRFRELSPAEQDELLTAALDKEGQKILDEGLYLITRNELCTSEDLFIHTYKDGTKQLVSVDVQTGKESIVRTLNG